VNPAESTPVPQTSQTKETAMTTALRTLTANAAADPEWLTEAGARLRYADANQLDTILDDIDFTAAAILDAAPGDIRITDAYTTLRTDLAAIGYDATIRELRARALKAVHAAARTLTAD
jgi:hypothetical protein